LKIREDTRVLEPAGQGGCKSKAIHLLAREGKISKGSGKDAVRMKKNEKNSTKHSRIDRLCPLIISAKEGPMINNMVLSREIEWIGYEHKRNMLQVEFIIGSIYQYENVPETVYQEFLTAPSHGRFFESNIKNKYQVRKIR
jgi:hypothetical protein